MEKVPGKGEEVRVQVEGVVRVSKGGRPEVAEQMMRAYNVSQPPSPLVTGGQKGVQVMFWGEVP